MSRKRRFFRIFACILLTLVLLFTLCIPAAAYPASFNDQRHRFTPFHMSLLGSAYLYDDIYVGDTWKHTPFELSLPSTAYNFTGERMFSAMSSIYLSDSDSSGWLTISSSQSDFYYASSPSSDNSVVQFSLRLDASGSTDVDGSGAFFNHYNPDFEVLFQNGYLTSEFGLDKLDDGIIFAHYSDSTFSSYTDGRVRGDFYVGNNPYEEFGTSYDSYGSILSYYAVLYHSDYPFLENIPENVDVEYWRNIYDSFEDVDFGHLTDQQIADLKWLFSWVGPIFGRFGVEIQPDYPYIDFDTFNVINFNMRYILTQIVDVENAYEVVIEKTIDSGKTGFERMTHWLGSAVSGFFSVEIMPNFSIGGLVVVVIAFSLVLWWLKVFAGG